MPACKKCNLPIAFKKIGNKFNLVELDGSDHFDKCSKARNDKILESGVAFTDKKGTGHTYKGKKMYSEMHSGFICGKNYKRSEIIGVPW